MNQLSKDDELVFRILCARAFKEQGEAFPTTDEEIKAFAETYTPSSEEREHFHAIVESEIDFAAEAAEEAMPGQDSNSPRRVRNIFELQSERPVPQYNEASAYRKPKDSEISKELDEEINRIIDDEEGQEENEKNDGQK